MDKRFDGFTLAEVLITLVIIGIIAAMTIPSLMNKTNEQETVVAVKKAYSVLGQAYQKMVAENGEINPSTLGDLPVETFGDMFVKQLNVQKVCGTSTNEDCFSKENGGAYKYFEGTVWANMNSFAPLYKIRLNDGMSVAIYVGNVYESKGNSEALNNVYGYFCVDVNGDKGPNTLGKDTFCFHITKYGILANGSPDDTGAPFSTCRTNGNGCTAWVVTKGNMDYLQKDVSW